LSDCHPFESTEVEESVEGYELPGIAESQGLYEDFFDEDDAADQNNEYINLTINGEEVMAIKGLDMMKTSKQKQ
jgi:hypothetical protein